MKVNTYEALILLGCNAVTNDIKQNQLQLQSFDSFL